MTDENLSSLELEVEAARAKLADDLSLLRSPKTYREFGAGLKSEAQSVVQRILDDVKARAAANPSAALAIGAGIAWRLLKHPPISTALIGAGLLSLWRTAPLRGEEEDYLTTAQQRLREQVTEAADTVKDYAAETAAVARDKLGGYAQSARETVEGLAASAAEETAGSIGRAREAATHMTYKATKAAYRATSQFGRSVGDGDVRDGVLLGVAGLAVVAALGLAYQRRVGSESGAWD